MRNEDEIKIMPDFTFTQVLSLDTVNKHSLNPSFEHYVILYFNSKCEFCNFDIQNILKNNNLFKRSQILLVSSEDINTIKKSYDVSDYSNISLYYCDKDTFYKLFKTDRTPSIYIYNKKKFLIKKFIGETKIQLIDSILNSN